MEAALRLIFCRLRLNCNRERERGRHSSESKIGEALLLKSVPKFFAA